MATATGKLINISPPHTVTSWCLSVRAPEIYSLSQFPVFSTVLFCFVFWLHSTACGILVPPPGIKPVPPSVEAWKLPLNHQGSPNTASPTIATMLYVRSLVLFLPQNCRFGPFDLHLPHFLYAPASGKHCFTLLL